MKLLLIFLLLVGQLHAGRNFGVPSTTDKVATTYNTNHAKMTLMIWLVRQSSGGGAFGRPATKVSGGTVDWATLTGAAGALEFIRNFDTQDADYFFIPPTDTTGWHCWIIVYEATAGVAPIMYYDGIAQSLTVTTASIGTAQNPLGNVVIGNHESNANNWGGSLAHFTMWSRLITAQEAYQLGALRRDPRDCCSRQIVQYYPLDGKQNKLEQDISQQRWPAAIVSGTGTYGVGDPIRGFMSRRGRTIGPAGAGGISPLSILSRRRRGQ